MLEGKALDGPLPLVAKLFCRSFHVPFLLSREILQLLKNKSRSGTELFAKKVLRFDGTIIVYYYYPFNYVLYRLLFCYVWWPCMAINISVQYNGGLLPDIKLLARGYYHRGTRFNAM